MDNICIFVILLAGFVSGKYDKFYVCLINQCIFNWSKWNSRQSNSDRGIQTRCSSIVKRDNSSGFKNKVTNVNYKLINIHFSFSGQHLKPFSIRLLPRHSGLIEIQSNPIVVNVSNKNHESHHNITLTGIHPGYLDVQSYVNHTNIEYEKNSIIYI